MNLIKFINREKSRRRCVYAGFTLVELMITSVILALIAGLAIPSYFRTVEQARRGEMCTNLNIIHMGQKIYKINNPAGFWNGGSSPSVGTINSTLNVDISTQYYDITNITGAATTYSATARRNTSAGGDGTTSCTYSYNSATGVLTKTPAGICD